MNNLAIKASACALVTALLFTGCESMSPEGNAALFGGLSGVGAGVLARSQGASTRESLAIGAATGAIVGATVYIVQKRKATERQRRIAEERARIAAHRRERQLEREEKEAARKQIAYKAKKKSRYIAVDTERDGQSTGKKSVMIFDTQSKEVVGNNVYDVDSTPQKGSIAKFDTYSAEYVGTGA